MPLFFHGTLEKLFARLRSHGMILKRKFPEEIDENNATCNPSATVLRGIPPATRAQPCCADSRPQPERNRAAQNTARNPSATVLRRIAARNLSATMLHGIPPATRAQPITPPKPNPPRNARKNALFLSHWCQGSNIQNGTMGHPTNFSVPPVADGFSQIMTEGVHVGVFDHNNHINPAVAVEIWSELEYRM
ncbi:hypothetical protein B0H14DRAFT_2560667 [Mycena olivaceomarginata]|nr:hypothetical protein B0H14DRAFT_2560667 [Mycena olivaceomarginata]